MNVLTSKRGLMHIPGVNALICASVKQDVAPKDHLSSISTFLTLFWCDFIWQNDLILHVHSEKCEMNDEWGEQFPGKHQTRENIHRVRLCLWFGGICLFNTGFCMKDHFVTMVLIQKIKLNLKYMKISFVWLLFIPALSHQMFPVLIKLLWVSALLGESLVRGERLSSYRPRVGYKQNVELRAATPSTWLLLVLSQSHWSVLKKTQKKSWQFVSVLQNKGTSIGWGHYLLKALQSFITVSS